MKKIIITILAILFSNQAFGYDLSLVGNNNSKELREYGNLDNFGRAGVMLGLSSQDSSDNYLLGVIFSPRLLRKKVLSTTWDLNIPVTGAGNISSGDFKGAALLYTGSVEVQVTIGYVHLGCMFGKQKVYANTLGEVDKDTLNSNFTKTFVGISL